MNCLKEIDIVAIFIHLNQTKSNKNAQFFNKNN